MSNTASSSASERIGQVASALLNTRAGGPPADAAALAALVQDAGEAYRVQEAVIRALGDDGPWLYWKSGGSSRALPLTHAPLPSAAVRRSPADMADLRFRHRLIEAEVALRLGRAVTAAEAATLTHEQAIALVDAMAVSIEVVDFRTAADASAPNLVKLADQQSHGALVLGEWQPFQARDWAAQRLTTRIGDHERAFTGTYALGDPTWLLPEWLRHVTRDGADALAGTVVTTGTWSGLLHAQQGQRVEVAFESIGSAVLQL